MLVNSGPSKHFANPKLVRGVESRMLHYTEINPPMEIKAAGHNTFFGTAQGILLVVVRDGSCARFRKKFISTALAAQKGVKTIFTQAGSIVDLGLFSVQLTRSDNLDHLDLAISK